MRSRMHLGSKSVAPAVACLSMFAVPAPSTAEARSTSCRTGYFWPGLDDERFPTIHRLRAIDLPRRTDRYAPRCLVAESVAGLVKDGIARAARRKGVDF